MAEKKDEKPKNPSKVKRLTIPAKDLLKGVAGVPADAEVIYAEFVSGVDDEGEPTNDLAVTVHSESFDDWNPSSGPVPDVHAEEKAKAKKAKAEADEKAEAKADKAAEAKTHAAELKAHHTSHGPHSKT